MVFIKTNRVNSLLLKRLLRKSDWCSLHRTWELRLISPIYHKLQSLQGMRQTSPISVASGTAEVDKTLSGGLRFAEWTQGLLDCLSTRPWWTPVVFCRGRASESFCWRRRSLIFSSFSLQRSSHYCFTFCGKF